MSKSSKQIKLVTLDTETYNGLKGDLKRIAIYDGSNVIYDYTFKSIEKYLYNWSQDYDVHVYIHNLEFDVKKLDNFLDSGLIDWSNTVVINNKLAVIKHKNYTVHDSFKILPLSLAKLCGKKGFNVEHGKLNLADAVNDTYPGQYTSIVDFLDRCSPDDPLFLEYLGYDVISLYEVLQALLDVSGIPLTDFVKRVSTASISRYIFKKGFKGKSFQCNNKNAFEVMTSFNYFSYPDYEDIIRAAYTGGRTEVFKMYLDKKGYHYDINSLYPYVMKNHPFPVGRPTYFEGKKAENKWKSWTKDSKGMGFIVCEVFIPQTYIPPLPVKMGKLCFPCGYVYGTFTLHELKNAVDKFGVQILNINELLYYTKSAYIFSDFIETFSALKIEADKKGNSALRYFSKLVMNTGYGYTGMRREKTQLKNIDYKEKESDTLLFINDILGYKEYEKILTVDYIQPQVAAYVTSFARMVILEGLSAAKSAGEIYYCDTDSIVCSNPLPDPMVDPYELGKFKLESQPDRAIFLKPKVYVESFSGECEVKFKGISKEFQANLSYNDYVFISEHLKKKDVKAINIEKDKVQFPSVMTAIKNNKDPNKYRLQDKVFNILTQDKRLMNYKENTTNAIYFDSLEEFEKFSFNQNQDVDFSKLKKEMKIIGLDGSLLD